LEAAMRSLSLSLAFYLVVCLAVLGAACGGSTSSNSEFEPGGRDASSGTHGDSGSTMLPTSDASLFGPDADITGDAAEGPLVISPGTATITAVFGQAPPTKGYTANTGGGPVPASFTIDRGEIGSIDASSGLFTATGTLGGTATITAVYGAQKATAKVTVLLQVNQNGATSAADAGAGDSGATDGSTEGGTGAGGNGGVGGEGEGGPVSGGTMGALGGTPQMDPGLSFLYPYDGTLWPQGILAPLLQWQPGAQTYDAVYIHISENAFDYKGMFAATATPFVHHPIDPVAWNLALLSNGGEPMTITLVFASGGSAYGPIQETWNVAAGLLQGTVYYNSYGTNLVHNYQGALPNNSLFGAATLGIPAGATSPIVVAGTNDLSDGCRVCHSVSADGSELVTQHANNALSSAYALQTGVETVMSPADSRFAWGGLFIDGSYLFSNSAPQQGGNTSLPSTLYAVPSGTAVASTGIPADLQAAAPVFSPDGKHVAFNWYGGAGSDGISLAVIDYDATSKTFSNLRKIFTPPTTDAGAATQGVVVWQSFLPTSDGVVFELQTLSNGRSFGETRSMCDGSGACSNTGAQGELWWVDLATMTPARLDNLNGQGYLPMLVTTQHTDDAVLNFEPTVNPVPSGGYAWVVFTSRRLYGNVATINPYWSDPRYHDLTQTPTPKKLWVAALDLGAKPGTDPSHPAFYLPGQELLAGNSRGYWVVNPCLANGAGCQAGDQCCGGFCELGDAGTLVCGSVSQGCSQQYEKCVTTSDCCGSGQGLLTCLNGMCSAPQPPPPAQ
jgi:hypothetical protein